MNYCEMYFNIIMFSSVNNLYQIKFKCQYSLSVIVSLCCCIRLYSPYNDVILLANSSETS